MNSRIFCKSLRIRRFGDDPCGGLSLAAIDCRSSWPHKDVILAVDGEVVADRSDRVAALDGTTERITTRIPDH